jgi:hypothetical protein
MTDLKIFIDEKNPLQDGTFPLIIELFHAGQQQRICTPYCFTLIAASEVEDGPVHFRCMAAVNDPQSLVLSYLEGALTSIKDAMAHLEACGKRYETKDILRLAGLSLQKSEKDLTYKNITKRKNDERS